MSRFVIYYNSAHYPLSDLVDTPFTHVILSFIIPSSSGPTVAPSGNLAEVWGDVQTLQQSGKKVMISFGGGTISSADYARLAGDVPVLAKQIADIVVRHQLDGVDIDYEDTGSMGTSGEYNGVEFMIELTKTLYLQLPEAQRLISHAPQPPYLSPYFLDGPYLKILEEAGNNIDWINMQYYNNPGFQDPDQITGLVDEPFISSVAGLDQGAGGIVWPAEKTVVGKPVAQEDAGSGYIPVNDLVSEVISPLVEHYKDRFGGVMGWQYYNDAAGGGVWHKAIADALL